MRGSFFITICSFFFGLVSCNYNVIKDPQAYAAQRGQGSIILSDTTPIGWNLIKSSIMKSCENCHVGHTAPELSSLITVQQSLNKVRTAIHENKMPPTKNGYQVLSDCQKAILDSWIQQGAPEISSTRVGDLAPCKTGATKPIDNVANTPIEKLPLTYQTLVVKILQPKCLKCHNPDGEDIEAAGILFYPYGEIIKRKQLWGDSSKKSKLVRTITRSDEDVMPPPEENNPLTPQEVDFVIRWIDSGKPEN